MAERHLKHFFLRYLKPPPCFFIYPASYFPLQSFFFLLPQNLLGKICSGHIPHQFAFLILVPVKWITVSSEHINENKIRIFFPPDNSFLRPRWGWHAKASGKISDFGIVTSGNVMYKAWFAWKMAVQLCRSLVFLEYILPCFFWSSFFSHHFALCSLAWHPGLQSAKNMCLYRQKSIWCDDARAWNTSLSSRWIKSPPWN